MILSTFQPLSVWEALQTTGNYHADGRLMNTLPDFERAYGWMVQQMEKRIGPRPTGVTWPVWAWYRHRGRMGRLDLRRQENWQYEPSVCIEFEVPNSQVLLSDFDRWHCVLNDWTCPKDEEDDRLLDAQIAQVSAVDAQTIKEATWERIFDLRAQDEYFWGGEIEDIQATFWELRLEYVRCVRACRVKKTRPF